MSFDLIKFSKKRIMEMFSKVKKGITKIFVVDDYTLKMISTLFKESEILEQNVSVIEKLENKGRQRFPQCEAIYLIRPESINLVINDFLRGSKRYSGAHMFFTSHVSNNQVSVIKQSNLSRNILNFVEINLDFIAREERVFDFQYPDDYNIIFGGDEMKKEDVRRISTRLSTFLSTIGEKPTIRFDVKNMNCEAIAERLQLLLLKGRGHAKKPFTGSLLIVVDRLVDLNTPLLHNYYYQSCMLDLLKIGPDHRLKEEEEEEEVNGESTNKKKKKKKKTHALDHNDFLWLKYRHLFVYDAAEKHRNHVKRFAEENKDMEEDRNKFVSTHKFASILHRYPKYKKDHGLIVLHTKLIKRLQKKLKDENIEILTIIEQDIITGDQFNEADGKVSNLKDPLKHVSSLLLGDRLSRRNKLRLLLLLLVSHGRKYLSKKKKKDGDQLKKIIKFSKVLEDEDNKWVFNNFKRFFLKPYYARTRKEGNNNLMKIKSFLNGAVKNIMGREKESLLVSRYTNKISEVTKKLVGGNLSEDKYPYVSSTDEERMRFKFVTNKGGDGREAQGGRGEEEEDKESEIIKRRERMRAKKRARRMARRAEKRRIATLTFSSSSSEGDDDDHGDEDDEDEEEFEGEEDEPLLLGKRREKGNKIFVFCVGGICFSEIRDFYLLCEKNGIEGAIGSTSLLTPEVFLSKIRKMKRV